MDRQQDGTQGKIRKTVRKDRIKKRRDRLSSPENLKPNSDRLLGSMEYKGKIKAEYNHENREKISINRNHSY